MTNRTVICWDGSPASEAAAAWALRRSRNGGTTVEIFDVLDRALFAGDPGAMKRVTLEEEQRLTDRVHAIERVHPGAVAGSALLVGDPYDLLAEQTGPSTLVVVGTRQRTGPRMRYGWSLGARLATSADGPVAIVPDEAHEDAAARSGVVVGVDGSPTGRLAMDYAAGEADAMHQPLIVVHCWQEPLVQEPLIVPDDEFVDSQQTAHQELLDDHVRHAREQHPHLEVRAVLARDHPSSVLRAQSQHAFMLVVGSRQLTGWKRAWLGSVSHALVLDLAAPTVIVGPGTRAATGADRQLSRSATLPT
ncbi:universal stress protein [Leifsonia sp. 2MCAF36]|uniref:universal stress protein n=1 Tax=Leifsonia sp. 2MCAF36 TaxID=3232988 RepID=UPI003F9D14F3